MTELRKWKKYEYTKIKPDPLLSERRLLPLLRPPPACSPRSPRYMINFVLGFYAPGISTSYYGNE